MIAEHGCDSQDYGEGRQYNAPRLQSTWRLIATIRYEPQMLSRTSTMKIRNRHRLLRLLPPPTWASRASRSRCPKRSPPGGVPTSSASSAKVVASSRNTVQAAVPCPHSRPVGHSRSLSSGSPARPTPSTAHWPTARANRVRRAGFPRDAPASCRSLWSYQSSLMVIHDFYVGRPLDRPTETDAPLRIDPNAVLTCAVAA